MLAVVGRPNVGKSTLVNRILGRREAVVEDKPGVTRDRVSYPADWAGRRFTLVDTGGWEVDVAGIESKVAEQAEVAISLADAVLFVVDATVGATATDERVVRLPCAGRASPFVLCANKVDGQSGEADAAYLWSLGLGEPHPVSALHGRGTGDLLDAAMAAQRRHRGVEQVCPSRGRAARTRGAARRGRGFTGTLHRLARLPVDLVGAQHDGLARLAHASHDALVRRGRADGRVDDEEHRVGEGDRDLGLLGDLGLDARDIDLPAAGVDEREADARPQWAG